jgi:tetratricopeptide (TPR) repeat protein
MIEFLGKTEIQVVLLTTLLVVIGWVFIEYAWQKSRQPKPSDKSKRLTPFPIDETGVLVLGIVGDGNNSLQRDLVSSLNDKLKTATNISVRAYDAQLDDTKLGVSVAHQKARGIGQQLNAQIVVWGNRAGEKKFWPRITIVKPIAVSSLPGERQLGVQEIDQMQLPESLVNEPVYLAFFLVGLSSYNNGQYVEALNALESALKHLKPDSPDIAPLKLVTANCRYDLAQIQNQPKKLLLAAIEEYQFALESFGRTKSPLNWAMTQNNLGSALAVQAGRSEGADAVRLLGEAVAACRAALEVRTREQFPQDWAMTQNNLGNALLVQAGRSEGADAVRLLGQAVAAYRAALEVRTREQFPQNWAAMQNNLGNALRDQAGRSEGADAVRLLGEAVAAYRAALEVRTRGQFPQDWAGTQSNLGMALLVQAGQSQGAEAARLLAESVTAYRAALEIYTPESFPDLNILFSNKLARAEYALHQFQK